MIYRTSVFFSFAQDKQPVESNQLAITGTK